jgi:hypothetical protein
MNEIETIDARVDVVVAYRHQGSVLSQAMPLKMKYQGQIISFTELGLRHPTKQGKRMIHVFDMSDGANDYRLEFDAQQLTWTLKEICPGRQ